MMGLYKDHRSHLGFETDYSSPRSKEKDSIKPLHLCASLPCTNDPERGIVNNYDTNEGTCTLAALSIHVDILYADAPAWLEIMHRRDRCVQLLYLVRISKNNQVDIDSPKVEVSINDTVGISDTNDKDVVLYSYARLWTGNNLAATLRFGFDLNKNVDTSNKDGDLCQAMVGQLMAKDQNCRIVSNTLSEISSKIRTQIPI